MDSIDERRRDEEYRRRRRERIRKRKQREVRRRRITLVLTTIIIILFVILIVKIVSACRADKIVSTTEKTANTVQSTEMPTLANPIKFTESQLQLNVGNVHKPFIMDSNRTELTEFSLKSENEEIVRVNENNELIATGEGDVTVICTVADGRQAECQVHVSPMSSTGIRKDLDINKPMVALTFDDGPNGGNTTSILETLNKYNGKATFFMAGYKIEEYPDIVRQVFEQGHEVANHSRDHLYANDLTVEQQKEQMESVNQQVKAIIGQEPTLFRCPGGIEGEYYTSSKMPLISWSIDTLDWKTKNSHSTYERITSVFEKGYNLDGDIVLMHDLQDSTPNAVQRICVYLNEKGYQMVTVSELAYYRGVQMEGGEIYRYFYKDNPSHNDEQDFDTNDSNENTDNSSDDNTEETVTA